MQTDKVVVVVAADLMYPDRSDYEGVKKRIIDSGFSVRDMDAAIATKNAGEKCDATGLARDNCVWVKDANARLIVPYGEYRGVEHLFIQSDSSTPIWHRAFGFVFLVCFDDQKQRGDVMFITDGGIVEKTTMYKLVRSSVAQHPEILDEFKRAMFEKHCICLPENRGYPVE